MNFADIDERPAYAISDAAFALRLPQAKVARWSEALDSVETITAGKQTYRAISFLTLLELHVFKAMRMVHRVPMPRIRKALLYLSTELNSRHPLIEREFSTNGLDVFFEQERDIVNASRGGQVTLREMVRISLSRIEWKQADRAVFFPYTTRESVNAPKLIEMQASVSFGRPVLAGTGIAAEVVAGRFWDGDAAADLAQEYAVSQELIDEAIRWEMRRFDEAA